MEERDRDVVVDFSKTILDQAKREVEREMGDSLKRSNKNKGGQKMEMVAGF